MWRELRRNRSRHDGRYRANQAQERTQARRRHARRKSGYLLLGKLPARTAAATNRALLDLLARHPGRMRTITADNGTEFHWYGQVEASSPVKFYFATPHHSWERETNQNTNGLIRQYLQKANP